MAAFWNATAPAAFVAGTKPSWSAPRRSSRLSSRIERLPDPSVSNVSKSCSMSGRPALHPRKVSPLQNSLRLIVPSPSLSHERKRSTTLPETLARNWRS